MNKILLTVFSLIVLMIICLYMQSDDAASNPAKLDSKPFMPKIYKAMRLNSHMKDNSMRFKILYHSPERIAIVSRSPYQKYCILVQYIAYPTDPDVMGSQTKTIPELKYLIKQGGPDAPQYKETLFFFNPEEEISGIEPVGEDFRAQMKHYYETGKHATYSDKDDLHDLYQ